MPPEEDARACALHSLLYVLTLTAVVLFGLGAVISFISLVDAHQESGFYSYFQNEKYNSSADPFLIPDRNIEVGLSIVLADGERYSYVLEPFADEKRFCVNIAGKNLPDAKRIQRGMP